MLIFGELTLLVKFKEYPLIRFLAHFESLNMINLLTLVPISYMFFAALTLFFSVKIDGLFVFQQDHTEITSFLFFSNLLCKVGFPLCYNFGQLLKSERKLLINEIITGTEEMVQNKISDLILDSLPLVLILFLLIKLFGFYDNILAALGFKTKRDSEKVRQQVRLRGKKHLESQIMDVELSEQLLGK